jgi:hypothetical protein
MGRRARTVLCASVYRLHACSTTMAAITTMAARANQARVRAMMRRQGHRSMVMP